MATLDEANQAVIDAIHKQAQKVGSARQALQLAEAVAWLLNPSQPHGSSSGE